MTILGEQVVPPAPTANQGANRIKNIYNQMCLQIAQNLAVVKSVVDRHGRSAIDTAMGADSTEFANFYATAKTFAENNPNCTVEDLPT